MSIVLVGSTSGSITLQEPAVSGSTVIDLPATSGTMVVTGGAQTVQFAAGSASTPSITFTGDTNTGIFSPGADTIAFTEGGTESMRITSDGNVGVGITDSNPLGNGGTFRNILLGNGAGYGAFQAISTATATGSTIGAFSGGTTGASGSKSAGSINIELDGTSTTNATGRIVFYTGAGGSTTERMRIDSSGNLLVGTTSAAANQQGLIVRSANNAGKLTGAFICTSSAGSAYGVAVTYSALAPNTTGSEFYIAADSSTTRFYVNSNGGIGNYSANNVNLSDAREKTNVELANNYLDKICSIPVKTFNYIDQNREDDDGLTLGVIAQDVQAVAPELVSESDWSVEKDGSKMRLSIYQTDLQYALMKCIQEQQAIITDLKARIETLENK